MKNFTLSLLLTIVCPIILCARQGDTRQITSHKKTKVVTDPAKGYNVYPRWTIFPSQEVKYRKAVLSVTYQCPESLHCGEWDYIDAVYLRRLGSVHGSSTDLELARLISPYGWRFGPAWKFTWKVDITDFAFLLHDSVEVEFYHTGYESNTDRGWLVTLDFALTEGIPAVQCLGIDTLWHGSFLYGDSTKSIEDYLQPVLFTTPPGAEIARLRILQTGHGMDDLENCAEFCSKYRQVYFDGSLVDQKQVWRRCGVNPLYPQGGTWIYDRANWCPGSMVYPDVYDLPVTPESRHTVNIDMQPYTNPKHPTASYVVGSYLFYCTGPWATNDVSIEEIVAPNTAEEYSRMNPICTDPRILIKNNGKDLLQTLQIRYGINGAQQQVYRWVGRLESQKSVEIVLPGVLAATDGRNRFNVRLELPNGEEDEYPYDNETSSEAMIAPTYGTDFVLVLRTNNDSTGNSYRVVDQTGVVVRERTLGSLRANFQYRDTLHLLPGCYQLIVTDTSGDGLDFWANPDGGYGYVRLLDMNGKLIKAFLSDFGSEINHYFIAQAGAQPSVPSEELPIVNPFPIRNPGIFMLDVFCNEIQDVNLTIVTEDSTRTVFEKLFRAVKELMIPVDISREPDGFYYVKIATADRSVSKKIKVKHKG